MNTKEERKSKSTQVRKKNDVFSFHWTDHGAKMKGFLKKKNLEAIVQKIFSNLRQFNEIK